MAESLLSYLRQIHWSTDFHWYVNHLDIGPLVFDWEQGRFFTRDEWFSIALLGMNLLVLLGLVHLLVRTHRSAAFRSWLGHKRSQLTRRPPKESQTKLEPKLSGSPDLQQAYNLHRLAMYDHALSKYKQAFSSSPYDLNTYLVGIKIVSEMDEPNTPFVRFLKDGISHLREKHPALWKEVARYGREMAPSLDQWLPAS